MILEKDIKELKFWNTIFAKFVYYFSIFIPIFFLIMGGLNLKLALNFGNNAGYTLKDLINTWSAGIDLHNSYSGLYLKALERLQTSLTDFAFSIILSILPFGFNKMKKRNKRILDTLVQHGIVKN